MTKNNPECPQYLLQITGTNVGDPVPLTSSGTAIFTTATLSPGNYSVTANYISSSGSFTSSTSTLSVSVVPALLTVSADDQSMVYGDSLPTLTASISGFVNGDNDSVVSGSPSLTDSATATGGVGVYSITVGQGNLSAANYTFAFTGGTLTISAATPTLTVAASDGMYTGLAYPATTTVAGVIAGVDDVPAASLEGVTPTLTYSGITASGNPSSGVPVDAGNYTVVASFPGSADYTAASASTTFTISAATPTVAVTDLGGTYNGQPYVATATVAGVVVGVDDTAPTLSYYGGGAATGTGTAVAPTHPGTYTVVASFAGTADGDYTAASASTTFIIGAATPMVFVTDAGGIANKNTVFPATAMVAGVVPGFDTTPALSLESVRPTLAYYDSDGMPLSGAPSAVGTYTVVATYAGSTDYGPASASATFVISSGATTLPTQIVVTDAGGTYNGKPFPAKAFLTDASGNLLPQKLDDKITFTYYPVSKGNSPPTDAGTWTVVATFPGNGTYSAASATTTFVIAKAPPYIRIRDAGGTYNGKPFPATANAVAVQFTYYLVTPTGKTLSGVPIDAGRYEVDAFFPGSTDYTSARASTTFIIMKATPKFGPLTIIFLGTGSVIVSGSIGLGGLIPTGTVTIKLDGESINATVDGTGRFTATFMGLSFKHGTSYGVRYTYSGDENFNVISDGESLNI